MSKKKKPSEKAELVRRELEHLGQDLVAEMSYAEIADIILTKYKTKVSATLIQSVCSELFGLRGFGTQLPHGNEPEDEMV